MGMGELILLNGIATKRKFFLVYVHSYENWYNPLVMTSFLYMVIPVAIDFCNLKYTGKSTRLQMRGHYILSQASCDFIENYSFLW